MCNAVKTSVVIATYNGERFIEQQLDSIISQTVLPSEIVISDDGSSDLTINIINEFIDNHKEYPIDFTVLSNNNNEHGVCANFEYAVSHARGEYIFFCDQDDIWLENKIERSLSILEGTTRNVLMHNAQVIKENDKGEFHLVEMHLMPDLHFDMNNLCFVDGRSFEHMKFFHCIIQGMCLCVKRSYLQSVLPFSRGRNHDDWLLFCALSDNTLIAVNEDLAYYRIHKNNTAGLPEYKNKRPFTQRVAKYDENGKKSIIHQFLWYKDAVNYLGNRPISNDEVNLIVAFFTDQRIELIKTNRLIATIGLLKSYKKGVYKIDGKHILFHDLAFVWCHSKKNRIEFTRQLTDKLRIL